MRQCLANPVVAHPKEAEDLLTHDGNVILDLEEGLLATLGECIEGVGMRHTVQGYPIYTQETVTGFQGPFPVQNKES